MTIPDFTFREGDSTPAEMHETNLLGWIVGEEALLVVLPRYTVAHVDDDGKLTSGDEFERLVRAHGGRPMPDLDLELAPTAPWQVHIDQAAATVTVTGPATLGSLYDGGLDANAEWHRLATRQHLQRQGIVVITGSCRPTFEAAMDMIASGRASWARAALHLTGAAA
ncbi:hypothetical protein [Nocardia sp. NPDC050710]|uniref:hypothetical protein n=1 Tax=Nocardia sp. NPDC050710 TaxID=3157220 RepID=UPI0033C5844C